MAKNETYVSPGSDFVISKIDRSYGGTDIECFKVRGDDGLVSVSGQPVLATIAEARSVAIAADDFSTPEFTVGAEAGNQRQVTVQFKNKAGANVGRRVPALVFLSRFPFETDASSPDPGWEIHSEGTVIQLGTINGPGQAYNRNVISDSNGRFRVNVLENNVQTWYVHVIQGTKVFCSPAVAFV